MASIRTPMRLGMPASRRSRGVGAHDAHAKVAIHHFAALLEVRDDPLHAGIARDGKADPVGLLLRKDDGGVDADDVAAQVEQRAARVAGVDLCGGLNQAGVEAVFLAGKAGKGAVEGADDTDAYAHLAPAGKSVGLPMATVHWPRCAVPSAKCATGR